MGGTRPAGLEARYYADPGILTRELDRIFARTWHLVGHRSQLASPGQLITATVGDQSVIVANDGGEVCGFYNVCQHRGHELVAAEAASVDSITCPYHAWTYSLGGRLLHARGEDVGELCVPRVRVETLAGFLYVNLDPAATSLAATLPGVEADLLTLAPDAGERVLTSRRTRLIRANWKLVVENYNECYHCPNVHKSFTTGVIDPGSYRIAPRGPLIHHTARGPAAERAAWTRAAGTDGYAAFFNWPVSSIQCYPGQIINTFRWVPLAVDETLLIREWWFDGSEPTPTQQQVIDLDWTTTVVEDSALVASVQRGLGSRGYRPGPLIVAASGVADVHSEDAVPHLQRLALDALGDR